MFKVKYVLILLCDLGVGASFRFIIIISISKLVPKRFALPVANVTNQMAQTRNLRCYLRYTIIDSAREDFFYKRKHTMSRNRRKMKMPLFFFFCFFCFRETHYTNLLLDVPTPREILQVVHASIRGMCHQFVACATSSSSSSASAGY